MHGDARVSHPAPERGRPPRLGLETQESEDTRRTPLDRQGHSASTSPGRVSQLSLGMRERVSLATAFLSSPKVILVDEAFSNLHDGASS